MGVKGMVTFLIALFALIGGYFVYGKIVDNIGSMQNLVGFWIPHI